MPEQSLKNLRSWRTRPDRDTTITRQLGVLIRDAAAKQRQSGGVSATWEATAPARLRALCAVQAAGGMLTIRATSAGARFQIDRWLGGGGQAALRSGGVTRVKLI